MLKKLHPLQIFNYLKFHFAILESFHYGSSVEDKQYSAKFIRLVVVKLNEFELRAVFSLLLSFLSFRNLINLR